MNDELSIGVLGLQGGFAKHLEVLTDLGVTARRVRLAEDLDDLDGIILPGGESTTMSLLLVSSGLFGPLTTALKNGLPVFGTCAGLIMLASHLLDGRSDQVSLNALSATVRRNGYGRQIDSFESDVKVSGLDEPFHAVFIRAPIIEDVADSVRVLARANSYPVLVLEGNIMASSFHPELVRDGRIHHMFLDLVREHRSDLQTLQSKLTGQIENRSP